jgi:predicted SnoaL-like aldol condensation-catalyzing enzyme
MKSTRTLLALFAVLAVAPVFAQEPVVGAPDPEKLFTDADPVLHANKQVALHVMKELLQCNYWDQADKWLSARYLQHNPNIGSGRDGVVKFFSSTRQKAPSCDKLSTPVVAVLADDNLVTVVIAREFDNPRKPGSKYSTSWFDMWRIVDGHADEHWDAATIAPPAPAR